jgi:hypothetical protein
MRAPDDDGKAFARLLAVSRRWRVAHWLDALDLEAFDDPNVQSRLHALDGALLETDSKWSSAIMAMFHAFEYFATSHMAAARVLRSLEPWAEPLMRLTLADVSILLELWGTEFRGRGNKKWERMVLVLRARGVQCEASSLETYAATVGRARR